MILVVDAGNTRIKWAHAAGPEPVDAALVDAGSVAHGERVDEAMAALTASIRPGVTRALVSNVAGAGLAARIDAALSAAIGSRPEFPQVARAAYGLECGYRDPARLGVDRWLAMIAAVRRAAGPVCVLGAGTAVTFDAVDADGRHLGGLILAGAGLMAAALDRHTEGIGKTAPTGPKPHGLALLGRSTDEAVGQGGLLAIGAALDRAIGIVRDALGRTPTAFLTGGDAERVRPWLENEVQVRADLVLEGLTVVAGDSG